MREENKIGGGIELKERLVRGREVGNMKVNDSIETILPSFDSHDFQSVSINNTVNTIHEKQDIKDYIHSK